MILLVPSCRETTPRAKVLLDALRIALQAAGAEKERATGYLLATSMLIAATALHYNLTILTFNLRHFSRIPDLAIFQPD
jgi:predicted nucleic acid-binding protein